MAITSRGIDTITTESDIKLLSGKKILQYPIGLGSSAVDDFGDKTQYMMIRINTDEKSTKLRTDTVTGRVVRARSTVEGTGFGNVARVDILINLKTDDSDARIRFGDRSVDAETWVTQKGMTRLDKVIVLPMPNDYVVKSHMAYRDTPMTTLTRIGDYLNNSATGMISDLWSLGKNKGISKIVNSLKEGATNERALLAEDRLAENPKQELLFEQVDRRSYQFNYTFAPKNELESMVVSEIIETLRYYSLPELTSGKMFYIFPSEFEISFMMGQLDNPNIPRIGTCVLSDVAVNYSPTGVWATLPNGAPLAVTVSLNFIEMEMIDRLRVSNPNSVITSGF